MSKIVSTKINACFLAIVLIAGTFAISSPLTVYGQQYEQDYSHNYQQDYHSSYYYSSDPRMHDNHSAKPSQKANCDNENVNVNDLSQVQRQEQAIGNNVDDAAVDEATLDGQQLTPEEEALNAITGNGDGGSQSLLNIERNIVNICINSNDNELAGAFFGVQNQEDTGEAEITDIDSDTIPDNIDNCPTVPNPTQIDSDADGIGDACDNCPLVPNPTQIDSDADGIGDACDMMIP